MGETALQLESLKIHRMYGIRQQGLALGDLSPGINIITGPNASGKTTLARAIEVVLWPDEDHRSSVEARFILGTRKWRADIDGSRTKYQKDGADAGRPPVPSSDQRDRYHLYLHELLQSVNGHDSFAETIQRETAGGYDVELARDKLQFNDGTNRKGQRTKRVESARKELERVKKEQKALWHDHQKLDALEADQEKAREAQRNVELLKQALNVSEVRHTLQEARTQKEAYPAILEQVDGTEYERLIELSEDEATAREEKKRLETAVQEQETLLDNSSIPEGGLRGEFLPELRALIKQLESQEQRAQSVDQQLPGRRSEVKTRWQRISSIADETQAFQLNAQEINQLALLAEEAESIRAEEKALSRLEELLVTDEAGDADIDRLMVGARYLRSWLASGKQEDLFETESGKKLRLILLIAGIALGIVGVIIGIVAHPLGWIVLLIGLVLAGSILVIGGNSSVDERSQCRREFERLGLDVPGAWSTEEVDERADELVAEIAEQRLLEAKRREGERLQPEKNRCLESKRKLEQERYKVLRNSGIAIAIEKEVQEGSLFWVLSQLDAWQEASHELRQLEKEQEELRRTISSTLDAVNQNLQEHGFAAVDDRSEAAGKVSAISDAEVAYKEAEQERRHLERQLKTVERRWARLHADRASIYDKLDVEDGNRSAVQELVRQREDFANASKEVRTCEVKLESEESRLRKMGGEYEEWAELSEPELKQKLEEERTKAADFERLSEEVARLKQRIDSAQESHDLEEAQTNYTAALEELEQERDQNIASYTGWHLANFVRESTRDESLPAVFHRARDLFAEITKDRYELGFDQRTGDFYASDTKVERGFSLDELSSGTRVQLLLAVRLAFIEQMESASMLPLVLDEALANSDDRRAEAIIRAVKTISKDGRQVFYFTAQQDEVRKWRAFLKDEDVESTFILLDERNESKGIEDVRLPASVAANNLSDPTETSREQYFEEMNVSRWSPREPLGQLHLWYLIDDLQILHRLVEAGFRHWGQLANLAARGGLAAVGLSEGEYRQIEARARAIEAWKRAYLKGRGKAVNRTVLERTDAVSDTYLERVYRLCQKVEGDGEAIIQGLADGEVKGFFTNKREELRVYFERHGYIDPDPTLSEQEMWGRIVAEVADDIEEERLVLDTINMLLSRIASAGRATFKLELFEGQ